MLGLAKDIWKFFIFHAVAAHFPNGLIPAALLFLFLSLMSGDLYFERTVLHLILLVLCGVPVSFLSGFRDWRTKFHGGRAPIFYKKIWLAGILFLLVGSAAALRLTHPGVLAEEGVLKWLYVGCLVGTLPVVVLLGHYGAKLAFQLRSMG